MKKLYQRQTTNFKRSHASNRPAVFEANAFTGEAGLIRFPQLFIFAFLFTELSMTSDSSNSVSDTKLKYRGFIVCGSKEISNNQPFCSDGHMESRTPVNTIECALLTWDGTPKYSSLNLSAIIPNSRSE